MNKSPVFTFLLIISIVLFGTAVLSNVVIIFTTPVIPQTAETLGKFVAIDFFGVIGFILLLCIFAIKVFDLEVKITKKK